MNLFLYCSVEMEEEVGRTRLGKETCAHASTHQAIAPRP
jgi:hypothetical protein